MRKVFETLHFRIVTFLVCSLFPLFIATAPRDNMYKHALDEQVEMNSELNSKIEELELNLCYLQMENPKKIARSKRRSSYSSLGLIKIEGNSIGNFVWRSSEVKSFHIHPDLVKVLNNYTGPVVEINSLHRRGSRKSMHYEAKAVDVRWDEKGKEMARWLITPEGKAWIDSNNVTIYFEKIYDREFRSGEFRKWVFDNPNATGAHIHVNI